MTYAFKCCGSEATSTVPSGWVYWASWLANYGSDDLMPLRADWFIWLGEAPTRDAANYDLRCCGNESMLIDPSVFMYGASWLYSSGLLVISLLTSDALTVGEAWPPNPAALAWAWRCVGNELISSDPSGFMYYANYLYNSGLLCINPFNACGVTLLEPLGW